MPDDLTPRFYPEAATPADLRHEAEGLDELADSIKWAWDRGHFPESLESVRAMETSGALRERAGDLNRLAMLKEAQPINQEAV